MKCSKCNSEMADGMLISNTPFATIPAYWATSAKEGAKMKMQHVNAAKCEKCGNIELHAGEMF